MSAKGENPASFVKHEAIERLAKGQVARARLFLNAGDSIAIIDMHAGDGRGVVQPAPDLFRGDESTATPILATEIGQSLRRDGNLGIPQPTRIETAARIVGAWHEPSRAWHAKGRLPSDRWPRIVAYPVIVIAAAMSWAALIGVVWAVWP